MLTKEQEEYFCKLSSQYTEVADYIAHLVSLRKKEKLSWNDIAIVVQANFNVAHDESYYRRKYKDTETVCGAADDNYQDALLKLQTERVKLCDERTQNRAYIRRLAREETCREIASDVAAKMNSKKMLSYNNPVKRTGDNEAILELSDWHYGIECENYWNIYNPEVARKRLAKLQQKVIQYCEINQVKTLHVVNLADLIAGRIHLTLRLESRIDVITQIIEVSEMMAELLNDFSSHMEVHYYDCLDNHSRLEPNKTDSLDLESLCRITSWYLKDRIGDHVVIHDNKFGEDIITFKCKGYNILGVHGDKDRPSTLIDSISRMTHNHYDLICTAHLHHFSADEKNETLVVSNGALMGTDTYAKNLRLSAKPSQNLIIVTDDCVAEAIYRIVL